MVDAHSHDEPSLDSSKPVLFRENPALPCLSLMAVDSSDDDKSDEPEGWEEFMAEVQRELKENKQQRKEELEKEEAEEAVYLVHAHEEEMDDLEEEVHHRSAPQAILSGGLMTPLLHPKVLTEPFPQTLLAWRPEAYLISYSVLPAQQASPGQVS